ncbi:MAG: transcriptional regulator [Legionellaceae bacterium]|nr:transcriptional regulator [Legionellaceae bacterium]|tara:strand:- start:683 stop:949 length:267 start_codon:yes stop_codon:yes gene_type:complete
MKVKNPNLIKIGIQIKELRSSKGFTQEGLAAASSLGRTYMGRVERGEQNISIQNLIQIAFALHVNVGDLIPSLNDLQNPLQNKSSRTV